MAKPFFSIIIPLYNKENFIENTLKSVLNQSFIDFEVIIVNDGSTDASKEKVNQFNDSRIKYFSKSNEGISIARNYGIQKSQADYICFLDADDYWYPNFLQTIKVTINDFPDQKVFATAIEIETTKRVFPAHYSIKKKGICQVVNYFEASSKTSVIWTSSAAFHKNVFEKSGVFDENIKVTEDTDLWIRVGMDFPVVFIWKILARYVFDEKSISREQKYIFEGSSFLKYAILEKENIELKKFLDLNRFSVAIRCKIVDDSINFNKVCSEIDLKSLIFRKRILLYLPAFIIKALIKFKLFLVQIGIGNSVFK